MHFKNLVQFPILFSLFLGLFGYFPLNSQQIVINEVMSNNTATLADEDGDYSDWIELYNASSSLVRLHNYGISDSPSNPFRWIFPDISLSPGSFFLLFASGKNKTALVIHLETVIDWGDVWTYFPGYSEPPADWHSITFNDSAWQSGPSGFGYGDDDDSTYVGPTSPYQPAPISIFIRKKITVSDVNAIEGILLHVDYDDGFVAYLNGGEIARANVGVSGIPVPFDQFASSSHEANLYRGLLPDRFRVDPALLQSGDNVLALQVHNEQLYSSDMTLIPFLTFEMSSIPASPRGAAPVLRLQLPQLHTNFRISASGEPLLLTGDNGARLDSMHSGNLPPDISKGRFPDGGSDWHLFAQPTPAGSNAIPGYQSFAQPPQVSLPAGFYPAPLNITLSTATPLAEIYYTLDGSAPTDSSLFYNGQIFLDSSVVLRARSFAPGVLPSATTTQTYFINRSYDVPVISLSTDPANFFDWNSGIYVMGPNASPDYPHFGANFWQDWEKPLHIEFFETGGELAFSIDAGVKIFGSWSRLYPQKSLSIFARERYGFPEIPYQVFPTQPITGFQALVLRNSGQDWGKTFFRDALTATLVSQIGIDVMAYRPVLVFINGQMWGIHNVREKMNEHYLAGHHHVDPENIDFIERDSVIHGDGVHYQDLLYFVETEDMTLPQNYQQVREKMDVENFMDYILSVLYFANPDWPWNNVRCWRPRTPDGKWKWMLYDMDYTFHGGHLGPESNTFWEMLNQQNGTTSLFSNLLANPDFRQDFINRFADHLNTTFDSARVLQVIQQLRAGIETTMPHHISRWQYSFVGPWWLGKSIDSMPEWYDHIEVVRDFAQRRVDYVRQHIVEQFQLFDGGVGILHLDASPPNSGMLRINHLILDQFPWSGKYFPSVPVKLQAIPVPGYRFSHWSGVSAPGNPTISVLFQNNQTISAVFEPDSLTTSPVVINEINYRAAPHFNTEDWVEFYNASGAFLDISGWQFKDSEDSHVFEFPAGTVLPADGYVVVCRDTAAFRQFFPGVSNFLGNMDFGLTSDGELVRLFDSQNNLIDSLTFGVTPPWPTQPNGNGPTLALKNPFLDNSLPQSWAASYSHGTPGALNDVYIQLDTENTFHFPQEIHLFQNYPNPFNSQTYILFSLPGSDFITLRIFDVLGREVTTLLRQTLPPGSHRIRWEGRDTAGNSVSSGIYFYQLETGKSKLFKKMLYVR